MIQRGNKKTNRYELIFFFLWVIIILPKPLQLISFIIFLVFLINKKSMKFDITSYLLLCFIVIYTISVAYNGLKFEHDSMRVLASINNLCIWVVALFIYLIYKNNTIDIKKVVKSSFNNFIILIILYLISIFMYNIMNISSFTFLNKSLYNLTWFNNANSMRYTGFMEYANLIIMFYFLFFPLFLKHCFNIKNLFMKVTLFSLSILVFLSTLSRSGYLLMLVTLSISIIIIFFNKFNKKLFFASSFFTLSIVVILSFYTELPHYFSDQINELLESREGSTETRTLILSDSITIAKNNSPLIGMGIKEISPYDNLPYGSHSTYIGLFYKTGYMGLLIATLVIITSNLRMILQFSGLSILKKLLIIFGLFMSGLFFVEDIDGSNWLIVYYFVMIGIIQNKKNWRES